MAEASIFQRTVLRSAERRPDARAVVDAGMRSLTFGELAGGAEDIARRLREVGVRPGDRVGVWAAKSLETVKGLYGILAAGASYVPVEASAPPGRNGFVFTDCEARAVLVHDDWADAAKEVLGEGDFEPAGDAMEAFQIFTPGRGGSRESTPELAYILYTSGSTGTPKGVMVTHENATGFIDWCCDTFSFNPDDRFSSHAPFHFDLSIFDLFVSAQTGSPVHLIGGGDTKNPARLGGLIEEWGLTVWYSTPSILRVMLEFGKLESRDLRSLKKIFFAGEVFPIKHLRRLTERIPGAKYFNLYGPTETNVCTWHEVPAEIPPDRDDPYPIGKVCHHLQARVVDAGGADVRDGDEGELVIAGKSVMPGYWRLPDRTADAFLPATGDGSRWYRTGDLVRDEGGGEYVFLGRRDRMVKRNGYRIELGEIESVLYRHPDVSEAALVAVPDDESSVRLVAFLTTKPEAGKISTLKLKQFCAQNMLKYMIPDGIRFEPSLPKTSTDKIDYETLRKTLTDVNN